MMMMYAIFVQFVCCKQYQSDYSHFHHSNVMLDILFSPHGMGTVLVNRCYCLPALRWEMWLYISFGPGPGPVNKVLC